MTTQVKEVFKTARYYVGTVEVGQLNLYIGECLTVYMGNSHRPTPPTKLEQIELRITPDGKLEIFADDAIAVKRFSEYYYPE